ncbi:MAG TPA: hypothetical protein P5081_19260 [Phycisphaerae bacterium]|nr:hypothetical protein [Phycisphaerae bacterium]HRW55014.1 hypothetical protein [Phycisphaerae bacterium]
MPEVSHVESDLSCIRCGHNLRSLAWDAKCVECGELIERSRVPSYLNLPDLQASNWLRAGLAVLALWILLDRAAIIVRIRHFWAIFGEFPNVPLILSSLGWPGIVASFVALACFFIAATKLSRHRYLVLLSIVCWGVQFADQVVTEFVFRIAMSAPGKHLSAIWIMRPMSDMAWASYSLLLLFIWLWLMRVIRFRPGTPDWFIIWSGFVATIAYVAIDLGGCITHLIRGAHQQVVPWAAYHYAREIPMIVAGIVLVLLRRKLPRRA